jgi:hypothetical protein
MENIMNTLIEKLTPGPLFYIIMAVGSIVYLLGVVNIREYIIQKKINRLKDDNLKIQAQEAFLLTLLLRLKRDALTFVTQLEELNSGVIDHPPDLPHCADNLMTSYSNALTALKKSTFVLTKYQLTIAEVYEDLLNGEDENSNSNS